VNSDSSDTPPRYASAKLHSVADKLRETPKLSIDRLPVLLSLFERVAHASIEAFRELDLGSKTRRLRAPFTFVSAVIPRVTLCAQVTKVTLNLH